MSEREVVLEVTQQQHEEMLAKGIDEEAILKPGKHVFRRTKRVATKEELHPSNTKVELIIKLDLSVLEHFKQRTGADETAFFDLINQELRAAMERDQKARNEEVAAQLLQNTSFVSALAQELKKVA